VEEAVGEAMEELQSAETYSEEAAGESVETESPSATESSEK